jgi:hypothetical protein
MGRMQHYLFVFMAIIFGSAALLYSGGTIFPHKPHLEMELECKKCHPGIASSKRAENINLPEKKSCIGDCHEEKIIKGIEYVRSVPHYRLVYNHEIHIMQDIACTKCHKGLEKDTFKPGISFPPMSLCFECHDNSTASKTCTLCHSEKVPFPHKTHLDSGTACIDCHKTIEKSITTDGAKDIPSRESCIECHDKKERHADVTLFPYKQIYKFNHTVHVKGQELGCKECHAVVYKKNEFRQIEILPKMDYCFECHDNQTASRHCMLCHINSTMPEDHYEDWSNQHGVKANGNLRECKSCHAERDFCTRCHRGIKKPLNSHSQNFLLTHRYEARARVQNCKACHSERFCRNCHISRGVSMKSTVYRSRHPKGWLDKSSPNFHDRKARMRLSSCTACHGKNDCFYCHSTKRR